MKLCKLMAVLTVTIFITNNASAELQFPNTKTITQDQVDQFANLRDYDVSSKETRSVETQVALGSGLCEKDTNYSVETYHISTLYCVKYNTVTTITLKEKGWFKKKYKYTLVGSEKLSYDTKMKRHLISSRFDQSSGDVVTDIINQQNALNICRNAQNSNQEPKGYSDEQLEIIANCFGLN